MRMSLKEWKTTYYECGISQTMIKDLLNDWEEDRNQILNTHQNFDSKNSLPGDLPCQINPNVTKKDIMDAILRHCKASSDQLRELCKEQPELLEQIQKQYPDFKL